MTIEHEILINQYGQDLLSLEELMQTFFLNLSNEYQRMYLNDVVNLIIQSKPKYEDVSLAIKTSQLKETYTPCVLLRKGISYAILSQIASLPNNERESQQNYCYHYLRLHTDVDFYKKPKRPTNGGTRTYLELSMKSRNVSKINPSYLLTHKNF